LFFVLVTDVSELGGLVRKLLLVLALEKVMSVHCSSDGGLWVESGGCSRWSCFVMEEGHVEDALLGWMGRYIHLQDRRRRKTT
jgi:hypothetical protein